MYDYRKWTTEQRAAAVLERRQRGFPWHGPPHIEVPGEYRIVTGAYFAHRPILSTPERLQWFEDELLGHVKQLGLHCAAWVVLPNHYHLLVRIEEMKAFSRELGQLHGRTSFQMNREDDARKRRVWYRCEDRCMRSEGHYYTTLNYIHNNPIKHGYTKKWTEWPFSSVHWYLGTKGRAWLVNVWQSYPVLNYGDKWDI
jgi:putative transposase